VPRELETFMFLNGLEPNREAHRSDVQQQTLLNIYEMVDSMTAEMVAEVVGHKEDQEGTEK
jgi:hypothetical protein